MARYKVKDKYLKELSEMFNSDGKQAVYELLRTRFNIKNPYFVLRRMCENPELSYNSEKDCFDTAEIKNTENVFMSMEELCSPIVHSMAAEKSRKKLIADQLLWIS